MSGPVNFTVGPHGGHLIVTNDNWETVKAGWPRSPVKDVTIVLIDGSTIFFPVHEIIPHARNCDVILKFFDSLYLPNAPVTDTGKLQLFVADPRIKLKRFYGHLDPVGIELLPHTIKLVALAIGSAADVEAIQGLEPWRELDELLVSVTPQATVEDLGPLPNVRQRGIFFPSLTDERVGIVVPAIAALTPQRVVTALYFPKSRLTSAGALRLAEAIRDMDSLQVKYSIVIEPSGDWQPNGDWTPDEEERSMLEEILVTKVVIPHMKWTMAWIYE